MSKRNKDGHEALIRKHAKLRFKRLVLVALTNYQWMSDADEQGLTLNVKKNVAMLIRKKHKTGILTMAQKGLLAIPHHTRTIIERKKLCTIVAGLGCFTQVPPKIRARLVPYLHFMLVSSGRTLMKEGDAPTTVYFVVSGELEMSQKIYNKVTRKLEQKPEAFLGPGDWIGEIELLEDDIRMNTYKATTNCEILVLYDHDFNAHLKPYAKKVWIEKKKAIASLSYLKFMNEAQIISACKFGILRQYDPLDTIYPDDNDNILHVHFVLSGECVLLQCLHMRVSFVKGETKYELPKMMELYSDNDAEDDKSQPFDVREILRSSSSLDEAGHNKKKVKRKAEFSKIEANCKLMNQKREVEDNPPHYHRYTKSITTLRWSGERVQLEEFEDYCYPADDDDLNKSSISLRKEILLPVIRKHSSKTNKMMSLEGAELEESEIFTASSSSSLIVPMSLMSLKLRDIENFATHFIDVGSMSFGGLFGVGEKGDHRVVMARTTVQCLLIPLYWLMEDDQNPGHVWQKMRFYLDRCIPSRESLFQDFIKTRKWAQFKGDCVEQFTHSTSNPTKIEDIPIIIRIVEKKQRNRASL